MDGLCREAALGPIRAIQDILSISGTTFSSDNAVVEDVRPIAHQDFVDALTQVRASVGQKDLDMYASWNKEYGSLG
jgi:SpoVK/Ycf46/Vps4 family AAA+-type ATPase